MLNRRVRPLLVLSISLLSAVVPVTLVGSGRTELTPVVGKVLVNGEPVANAMVAFHPLVNSAFAKALPVATSALNGSFALTTYTNGDGAPPGEYAVTIVWPETPMNQEECTCGVIVDRLGGRYSDPAQTPLKIAVHPGKNEFTLGAILPNAGWSNPRLRDADKKN
jgi:hypothetical protein